MFTLEEFYEIMGLNVINNPLYKAFTADGKNARIVKEMDKLVEKANELYSFITEDPEGYLEEDYDWDDYYSHTLNLLDHLEHVEAPEGYKNEDDINAFRLMVSRVDEGFSDIPEKDYRRMRCEKLDEIADGLPVPSQEQVEARRARIEEERRILQEQKEQEEEARRKAYEERQEKELAEIDADIEARKEVERQAAEKLEEEKRLAEEEKARSEEADSKCEFIHETSGYKLLNNEIKKRIKATLKSLSNGENTLVSAYNEQDNVKKFTQIMNYCSLFEAMRNLKENDTLNTENGKEELETIKSHLNDKPEFGEINKVLDFFHEMNSDIDTANHVIDKDVVRVGFAAYGKTPVVQRKVEEQEQQVEEQEEIDTNTINMFTKHHHRLENAKTKRNSKEYEKIIKTVEWVNQADDMFANGANLTKEQRYAAKLLVIKNSINEYIAHKAEKGVNKNIGDKLAVVEELNKEVSDKLVELRKRIDPFTINGKEVNLNNLPITEAEEIDKAKAANPKERIPAVQEMAHSTDDCMQRIITKAIEKKYSSSHIKDLNKMREVLDDIECAKYWKHDQPTNGGIHM